MKFICLACLSLPIFLAGCAFKSMNRTGAFPSAQEMSQNKHLKPGRLAVIQGPTSESETLINVMAPRLKEYTYKVTDPAGKNLPVSRYETIQYAPVFYKVDKLHVKGLKPGLTYKLTVSDEFRKQNIIVDERQFSTLELSKNRTRFATLSCMSDDWRFEEAIEPMWAALAREKPEFLVLNGDLVYVDSFDFVERQRATEQDLWQRYIDTLLRLPLYHEQRLIPIFASWDDHDYGTNDGDRDFLAKDSARRVFKAFYGGPDLPGVFENGPGGTYSVFKGFQQRFYLMDSRSERHPKESAKQEPYGHWGDVQHRWLMTSLAAQPLPSWIFSGDQFFSGKNLSYKESFESDHPAHFKHFLAELRSIKTPVAFASGDIHFSEIMRIPPERGIGYLTYEITSSAMHSYVGEGWENPLRVPGLVAKEFNFLVVTSENREGRLKADVRAVGLGPQDYFKTSFEVKR